VPANSQNVILFDGVCHLCNGFVRFVIRRDPAGVFAFAPLQSDFARRRLGTLHLDSIVLLEGDRAFYAETAVLRICARLSQPLPMLARIASLIPLPVLAWTYRTVARYRYRIFGRDEVCALPLPEWKGRFLS